MMWLVIVLGLICAPAAAQDFSSGTVNTKISTEVTHPIFLGQVGNDAWHFKYRYEDQKPTQIMFTFAGAGGADAIILYSTGSVWFNPKWTRKREAKEFAAFVRMYWGDGLTKECARRIGHLTTEQEP